MKGIFLNLQEPKKEEQKEDAPTKEETPKSDPHKH